MKPLFFVAVLLASCDAKCDDRYHKAEDYKREPDRSSNVVVPFVCTPMRPVVEP